MPYIITCTTNVKNNSTYKNIRSLMDNNIIYEVAKFVSYRDALSEMENILEKEYDAEYDLDNYENEGYSQLVLEEEFDPGLPEEDL